MKLFILTIISFVILLILLLSNQSKVNNLVHAVTNYLETTIQYGTFSFAPTASPTQTPTPNVPRVPIPAARIVNAPNYCIDDSDPDGCDDTTGFYVEKGTGGIAGNCGTVIEQSHKIVASLPQDIKAFRDSLNPGIDNCNYSTGTYASGYVSTFFVIDSFNLAGFHELSKNNPTQVSGSGLLNWWKSAPAVAAGYTFIPYSPTVLSQYAAGRENLTGCVMFLNLNSGVHVGIVNLLEVVDAAHGNGIISILQSGARYFLDRFEVVGWDIKNTPLHQTQLQSVAGFGCHN